MASLPVLLSVLVLLCVLVFLRVPYSLLVLLLFVSHMPCIHTHLDRLLHMLISVLGRVLVS